jgi:hypothetical protein
LFLLRHFCNLRRQFCVCGLGTSVSFLSSLAALAVSSPFGTLALNSRPFCRRAFFSFVGGYFLLAIFDRSFALPFCCDDFVLNSSVLLIAKMDETRIDDTNQEDGAVDDIALLQAQYTRIRTLQSLSAFSDDSARAGIVPSSPTRSPLHLASLSSEPLRSPYTDGSPNTAAAGLSISSVFSLRDELLRDLRQELFAEMRSELLRSKQETAMILQENAAFRKRIDELESASVRASTPTSSGSHRSTPASSTPASPANNMPPDQPAGSHLVDPVVSLTQLGDFTADEARWALFQSNNIVDVAAEILLSGSPVPSARIRLDEAQYRLPRGRGRGGHTLQPSRSSLSAHSVHVHQSAPIAAGSAVHDEQLASTLGKLTDVIGNLGTLITDNMSRNVENL